MISPVTDDSVSAADTALALMDLINAEEFLPRVHTGLANGPVLHRGGDVFGPVVNIAARIAGLAHQDSIRVDDAMATALGDTDQFTLSPCLPRRVRGYLQLRSHRLRWATWLMLPGPNPRGARRSPHRRHHADALHRHTAVIRAAVPTRSRRVEIRPRTAQTTTGKARRWAGPGGLRVAVRRGPAARPGDARVPASLLSAAPATPTSRPCRWWAARGGGKYAAPTGA